MHWPLNAYALAKYLDQLLDLLLYIYYNKLAVNMSEDIYRINQSRTSDFIAEMSGLKSEEYVILPLLATVGQSILYHKIDRWCDYLAMYKSVIAVRK